MPRFIVVAILACFNAGWVVPLYLCFHSLIQWCEIEVSPVVYGGQRQVNSFPFLEFAGTSLLVACAWIAACAIVNTLLIYRRRGSGSATNAVEPVGPLSPGSAPTAGRDHPTVNRTRTRRAMVVAIVVVLLYAVTWIGGWITHARDLDACAARDKGFNAGIAWCFPILPGILVADSGYTIGPKHANDGVKVVLFYGFGSVELVRLADRRA